MLNRNMCKESDPKGLYRKAKQREIDSLIGLNTENVPPSNPEIVLDSDKDELDELFIMLEGFIHTRCGGIG